MLRIFNADITEVTTILNFLEKTSINFYDQRIFLLENVSTEK